MFFSGRGSIRDGEAPDRLQESIGLFGPELSRRVLPRLSGGVSEGLSDGIVLALWAPCFGVSDKCPESVPDHPGSFFCR